MRVENGGVVRFGSGGFRIAENEFIIEDVI